MRRLRRSPPRRKLVSLPNVPRSRLLRKENVHSGLSLKPTVTRTAVMTTARHMSHRTTPLLLAVRSSPPRRPARLLPLQHLRSPRLLPARQR